MVEAMDANPQAAMGGYPVSIAKHMTGAEYLDYPGFEKWRNPEFARSQQSRRFRHLQGGVLIIRRTAYESVGGFSEALPQGGTDLEYSYYLESCGYELAAIPGVYSITTKTQPAIHTLVDDNTLLAHPLTPDLAERFDRVVARTVKHCNVCDWLGVAFEIDSKERAVCPSCRSTPFARTAMRRLSISGELQRRPNVVYVGDGGPLKKALKRLCPDFRIVPAGEFDAAAMAGFADQARESPGVLLIDHAKWPPRSLALCADLIIRHVNGGGHCVVGEALSVGPADDTFAELLTAAGMEVEDLAYLGRCGGFDTLPVLGLGFSV